MHNLNEHFEKQLADCLLPTSDLYYMTVSTTPESNGEYALQIMKVAANELDSLQSLLADYEFVGHASTDHIIPKYVHKVHVEVA